MPRPNTDVDWAAARLRALNGTPLREIARLLGVSTGTVLAHASRQKWNISKVFGEGGSAKIPLVVKNKLDATARRTTELLADSFQNKNRRSRLTAAIILERLLDHFQSLDPDQLLANYKAFESVIRASDRVFASVQSPH